jgi:hypothetical protein
VRLQDINADGVLDVVIVSLHNGKKKQRAFSGSTLSPLPLPKPKP